MEKICRTCQKAQDVENFYLTSKKTGNRFTDCKECTKDRVRKNRLEKIDYYRKYDLLRSKRPARAKNTLDQMRKWREEDRRRSRCHAAVARAIRIGSIEVKGCEWPGCGRDKAYAHHESYDKPLDVIFYCQPHHKARHKQMKQEGIEP